MVHVTAQCTEKRRKGRIEKGIGGLAAWRILEGCSLRRKRICASGLQIQSKGSSVLFSQGSLHMGNPLLDVSGERPSPLAESHMHDTVILS